MADMPFLFLLTLAVTLLLWDPAPSLRRCVPHRRPARPRGGHALGRAAAARGVRRVPDHQADQLAEGRGRPSWSAWSRCSATRGWFYAGARAVRDDRQHRRLPVLAGDDVRRLLQDEGAGQRAVAVHDGAAGPAADRAGLHLDHRVAAGPLPAAEVLAGAEPAGGELRHPGHRGPAAGLRQGGVRRHLAGVRVEARRSSRTPRPTTSTCSATARCRSRPGTRPTSGRTARTPPRTCTATR